MSREQFEKLPEGPPFYDYTHGEAIEAKRPSGRHQQIQMRLGNALWEHALVEHRMLSSGIRCDTLDIGWRRPHDSRAESATGCR